VGIFGIMLVYYISNSYKQFAYTHHAQAIQQLANLEIKDLTDELKANSLDLALAIENESDFKHDFRYKRHDDLTQQLDNQFYQYFVTAGVIKLLKLYVLDTNFTLLSVSNEGITTQRDSEIICPNLSKLALNRYGSEKLQTMSYSCLYKNHPVHAVLVPFGGLNPKGYIQVVTDLAYNLQKIEKSLAMPVQITLFDGQPIYQSDNWELTQNDQNYLAILIPVLNEIDKIIMNISVKPDMTVLNKEIVEHRNWIMALAFVTTALTVFIVLLILQRSTIPPLAKIHDVLEKIHVHSHSGGSSNRLLFEQLLEQIIKLRRKHKTSFSVMILDLTHFNEINVQYGKEIGDTLLQEVELRLSTILRDSDLISWVGTDSPGHKLLPTDTKTSYHATIARLGGDEFGLLLPSAQSETQASAVAERIIDIINTPFIIQEHNINIGCKIGISTYPIHGDDEKVLIRNADKAMHQAKAQNRNVSVFKPEFELKH
jgi:GGDEF domain-containing protein